VGTIDPDEVANLGGQFHIPKLRASPSSHSKEDQ